VPSVRGCVDDAREGAGANLRRGEDPPNGKANHDAPAHPAERLPVRTWFGDDDLAWRDLITTLATPDSDGFLAGSTLFPIPGSTAHRRNRFVPPLSTKPGWSSS